MHNGGRRQVNAWHDPYGADNYGEMRRRLLQGVSDDDMASKEEYYDFGYLNIIPDWARNSEYTYWFLARQIGRARIDPDKGDMERYIRSKDLTLYAEDVHNFLKIAKGMSDKQISEQFVRYFSGLEKRVNGDYFERIRRAKSVFRGISSKELRDIRRGIWNTNNMKKPGRRWVDVSTNTTVARNRSLVNQDSDVSIMLEIDMDSIRDRLASPGYSAAAVFTRPKDNINQPDALMRGMFNEEHHIPPDVDLRKVEMIIQVAGSPAGQAGFKKEYEGLYADWAIKLV